MVKNKTKVLKELAKRLKAQNDHQEGRIYELGKTLEQNKEKEQERYLRLSRNYDRKLEETERLTEIIRWLINPKTAYKPKTTIKELQR